MAVELKIPEVGESIAEVQIGEWLKASGDFVEQDTPVVEIESDKATLELPAPVSGKITEILKKQGEAATIGEVIGYMEESGAASVEKVEEVEKARIENAGSDAKSAETAANKTAGEYVATSTETVDKADYRIMPAARRILEEASLSPDKVEGTGPGGRILKADALRAVDALNDEEDEDDSGDEVDEDDLKDSTQDAARSAGVQELEEDTERQEWAVPMTPMRKKIATQLVNAQQTAALLTTFNEIDMTQVMALRERHKQAFQKKHEIKLGFMSFFVKGVIEALKECPKINGEIRDGNIIQRNYYDIGIAVSGGKGLVVPVIRNAERMSFAEIELTIADLGQRAQSNRLAIDELQGGTFTISNGGIFGSLLSTPIVNPPQSGILGMHAIQERPVAHDGQVVIRPMMYIALTYDHRIVDGREAVTFLRRVKECVEDPARILLEI